MNPLLAAILGGTGLGIGKGAAAIQGQHQDILDRERQARRDTLAQEQLTEQRRHNIAQEGASITELPVEQIPAPFRPAGVAAGQTVRVSNTLLPLYKNIADVERRARAGKAMAAGIPNAEDTMAFTSPEEGSGMQPVPADPQAAAVKAALLSGDLDLKEALPFLFPKPTPVSETTVGFIEPRGKYTPLPGADRVTPPPAEGTSRTTKTDRFGRQSFEDRPIEAKDDFDRAAFTITNGRVRRYEDLSPAERTTANEWVSKQPWRNPVVRDEDKYLSPEEAGSLGVPYGTRKGQAAAKGPTPLTTGQRTKMDAQASVLGMVDKMERDLAEIAQPTGPLGRIWATPQNAWGVYAQADPKMAAFHRRIQGTLALVVRALGEVGTLTDKDIARAEALQPAVAPIPDTAEVVKEKLQGLRDLVQEVASRTGTRPESVKLGGPAGVGNTTATPQTQGAPVQRWGRDAQGRPVRLK